MELPNFEAGYKNAQEILDEKFLPSMNEKVFDKLARYFRTNYLHQKKWAANAAKHRKPAVIHNEVLEKSGRYIQTIDQRAAMHHVEETDGRTHFRYVPERVETILESDKDLHSVYQAIERYCEQTGKDLQIIAVHLAERVGIFKARAIIQRQLRPPRTANIQEVKSGNTILVNDIIDGIRKLQSQDLKADCIRNARQEGGNRETLFRDWFNTFLSGRFKDAIISAEEEKGNGCIDLKINYPGMGIYVIEFKGWWNYDKGQLPEQVCGYLTDFEKSGYVFMINHCKEKDIAEEYKKLIISSAQYIVNSWVERKIDNTDYSYYVSRHKYGPKEKEIIHFLFNVYFSPQQEKNK
ncbi:MAG: hypothetical protein E6Q24_07095 [Chitinophagaceae bacterium]|nr:MAG: hypothetical protein E6Q24_07095 [Chitinophagaceae bacterium]